MQQRSGIQDFEHLLRPVVLTVLLIIVFFVARAFLVPDDFGLYGHYRAGALNDVEAQPVKYGGHRICLECHDDVGENRAGSAHEKIGCEACHGALAAHAEDPTEVVPVKPDPATVCLRCHEYSSYRPSGFPQVDVEDHAMGDTCDACHVAHRPEIE